MAGLVLWLDLVAVLDLSVAGFLFGGKLLALRDLTDDSLEMEDERLTRRLLQLIYFSLSHEKNNDNGLLH